ncbi:kinase activator [Lithospermum erythrorhizon]|uniref:Kinase activator n=1 Tax=Lithospermum erythrorhizon TaxID=34254 RepID=A0AAV3PS17_LITER
MGAAEEGRNRRALGDIGNLKCNAVKLDEPIGKGVGGKKLTHKKCNAVRFDVPVVKEVGGRKPAQKNTLKQAQPEEAIEISPDTEEKEIEKNRTNKNRCGVVSARKKQAPTLTATLISRSKADFGLSNKLKEQIVDIDPADVNNELAVVEYIDDMYKFYKLAETETRVHDYIDSHPEISKRMRAIRIDWLVEKTTLRIELQLVGLGSMLIASKYEEIWAPEVNDFFQHLLVRYIKALVPDSAIDENLAYFLAELGMMNYETIIYSYSMIVASAVYAARCTMNKSLAWTEMLKVHTGFSESQLMDCGKLLLSFHAAKSDEMLRVIRHKYSSIQRGAVALLLPANLFCCHSIRPQLI